MKKTKYFTVRSTWNQVENACSEVVEKRDNFSSQNTNEIKEIDSEDLKVEYIGGDSVFCILILTYV